MLLKDPDKLFGVQPVKWRVNGFLALIRIFLFRVGKRSEVMGWGERPCGPRTVKIMIVQLEAEANFYFSEAQRETGLNWVSM